MFRSLALHFLNYGWGRPGGGRTFQIQVNSNSYFVFYCCIRSSKCSILEVYARLLGRARVTRCI